MTTSTLIATLTTVVALYLGAVIVSNDMRASMRACMVNHSAATCSNAIMR